MVSCFKAKEKVMACVTENIKMLWVVYGGLGAFSFLWGKNLMLFGKHTLRGNGLKASEVIKATFPCVGCIHFFH